MVKDITSKARVHAARDFGYADNTYNRNVKGPFFQTGDYCYVLLDCPKHKFSKRWRGPYRIKDAISQHLYIVEMENNDRICNVSKLKHYHVNRYSPEEIQKFLPASMPTCTIPNTALLQTTDQVADQVPTADRGRDTTDQVVTTPTTSSQDRTQPVNCFILPSSNSEPDNTRRTARKTRAPDFFQAGFD